VIPRFFIAGACALTFDAQAQTTEVAGVNFDDTLQIANSKLQLNGAGVRYKFVVKVYAAGLYLAAKASTTEAVLAAPGPKRIQIVMLREIDGNELGRLSTRGMEDNNSREDFSKSIPGTIRISETFSLRKRLLPGEHFSLDWIPGAGTQIWVLGKPIGEPIKEPEFFAAMMRIWLGKSPADAQLKDALLGKPRSSGN
jgi:hypothetical protein